MRIVMINTQAARLRDRGVLLPWSQCAYR